mmetsp:Transcript_36608/g.71454  ORF Transcript_36608/g.71454 Transcript_36608/m.71454 type:complete len:117 (+) Transcript_36608:230-580(+)|eukprot:CAMPEP_0173379238 /NCGR_PEP_ID=MMETSP1356-20130122/2273_1 /TAXON_ID=77927 ORGANISM="Hemiselmis virescens, Strain PCC157" /NCGR_SAMPLE_ID=MMETSP1356 /ASSEMBLY_ACC=CAM_ASM_000847 /LENGTH=116 /DNA_ID=CAMNT_0014332547 /DNA_START=230 /DNA_END=580 /DNA_ORIENTATION=+
MGAKPLKIHVAKHGAGGKVKKVYEKNIKCYICGELFSRSYLAKAHEKVCKRQKCHGDPKPFKCSVCGKGFVKRDHLLKHRDQNHKNLADAKAISSATKETVQKSNVAIAKANAESL